MACKDMNRVIDDTPVFVKQWSATKGLENLSLALNAFGPSFGPFVMGDYKFPHILGLIASKEEDTIQVLKSFVTAARIDGKEVKAEMFDFTFNGDYMKIFKIFSFVCETQYKDFFLEGQDLQKPDNQSAPD